MNALHPRELGTSFRGLTALVLEKRRTLTRMPLWVGLPIGLFASFLARVKHAEPLDLAWTTALALMISALLGPILATAAVTLTGNQVGTRSRRDELLALPLGRLAIPSATLVNALLISVGSYVAFLVGLSFFLGRAKVLGAVFTAPIENDFPFTAVGRFGAASVFFVFIWSITTVAHAANLVLVIFGITGALLGFLPGIAGFTDLEMILYLKLWVVSLAAFALVTPFALYARAPRHWAITRMQAAIGARAGHATTASQGPAGCGVLAAALVLGLLGYLGMGKAVVLALLVSGWAMRRSWRRLKGERRLPSHIAVALGLALAFVAPVVTLGLVADAHRYARIAEPTSETLADYSLAPDGRHVVATFQTKTEAIARALVFDLSGKEPPRVLPPREASLEPACCWSRDGRYLAVHEAALGRICPPAATAHVGRVTWGLEVMSFDEFMERQSLSVARSLQGTWLLDTQTGALKEREVVALAPGWSTPEELVSFSPGALGGCEIADGRGRSALWEKPDLAVDAYTAAGVELVSEHERSLLGASGVAPVDTGARWDVSIGPEHGRKKGQHPSLATKLWDYTFVKGEKKLFVADNVTAWPYWLSPTSVLLWEHAGANTRLDLETGERTIVWQSDPTRKRSGVFGPTWSAAGDGPLRFVGAPYKIVVGTDGEAAVVDLETGTERPLPSFPGFLPRVVQGNVVLGLIEGKGLAASIDGSAPKPLF